MVLVPRAGRGKEGKGKEDLLRNFLNSLLWRILKYKSIERETKAENVIFFVWFGSNMTSNWVVIF